MTEQAHDHEYIQILDTTNQSYTNGMLPSPKYDPVYVLQGPLPHSAETSSSPCSQSTNMSLEAVAMGKNMILVSPHHNVSRRSHSHLK